MKMADCPTSVRHRIAGGGEEDHEGDLIALRYSRQGVAKVEAYLKQHGHGTPYDIAAAGLMSEEIAGRILPALKGAGRVWRVDRVRVPCKPGSERPRKQTRYALAEKFKA